MSFSADIKKEVGKLNNLAKKEQVKYELIGYLISANTSNINKNKIKYATESDYNINRFSKLLLNLNIEHDINIKGKWFIITLKKAKINQFLEIIDNKSEFIKNNTQENKRAIIRGVFLGAGSVNNPEKKYHLEISISNKENLEFISELIKGFGVKPKILVLEDKFSIYFKDGEEISKFLALIGASKAVLRFEDIRVERDMRGKINRIVNCETANLNKTINASVIQIEAIERLKKEKRFNKLNDNLKEMAKLRIENPNMPLQELGKLANPPVGKSGVNYRLKKIMEIANE